jgi:urocanate hydratase
MRDGSAAAAVSNLSLLNAVFSRVDGATWVSIHHSGGAAGAATRPGHDGTASRHRTRDCDRRSQAA